MAMHLAGETEAESREISLAPVSMRPGMDTGFRRYDGGGGFVPFVGTLPKVVTNVIEWDSNPFSLNGRRLG